VPDDGYFDNHTEVGVRDYQRTKGVVPANGVVDENSWNMIASDRHKLPIVINATMTTTNRCVNAFCNIPYPVFPSFSFLPFYPCHL
jgi:hypothetical protein